MIIKEIKNILSVLNQPYPFYYGSNRLLKLSLIIVCFITLFLVVIKPFDTNINEFKYNYFITCVIYGMISGLSFLTTTIVLTVFCSGHCKEEKWTVAKELKVMIILLFIIGNANFFIRNLINTNHDNYKLTYYFEELIHTCLVGIFPIGFFTMFNFSYLYKANNETAIISNSIINQKGDIVVSSPPTIVTIASQSVYESVSISIHNICFIKSDGNYIEIYQYEKGNLKKQIIRNTLKDIERQLSSHANIVKTHRSYLVNVNHIKSVKGNAQGYTLYFKNCNDNIPVSRNNISQFDSVIKELTL
jgi:hypothetical protein